MKPRMLKKQQVRAKQQARKAERRKLDSHRRFEPRMFWARVMRIELSAEAWNATQGDHYTYWYMAC